MNIKIIGKTVTPLSQIEDSSTVNGVPTVQIKKQATMVDGDLVNIPLYSGNGWRGQLHREMANEIMVTALSKGIKVDRKDFHINAAGGGSNYQSQELNIVNQVRDLNPICSIFGVSLAVEGKLMISDLVPVDAKIVDGKYGKYSKIVQTANYIKKDDLLNGETSQYSKILTDEDIEQYNEDNEDVQTARKKEREDEDSKSSVGKLSIKAYNAREYIVPGTVLVSHIGSKIEMTSIEKGALLCGVEKMMKKQIGSTQNLGFGVMEYTITIENENGGTSTVMTSVKNENNIYNPIVETFYNDEQKDCIADYKDWLKDITKDSVGISKYMVETVKKKK